MCIRDRHYLKKDLSYVEFNFQVCVHLALFKHCPLILVKEACSKASVLKSPQVTTVSNLVQRLD